VKNMNLADAVSILVMAATAILLFPVFHWVIVPIRRRIRRPIERLIERMKMRRLTRVFDEAEQPSKEADPKH
jgi:hypothetical protein